MKIDNTPDDLDPKFLGTITKDFVVVSETLKEGAYQLRARKIDEYPIFPISKVELPIGQIIIARQQMALEWHYSISYLNEFIQRKLIDEDKVEDFIKNYKNPDEFCCLFVVEENFTNFVFVPYPED